MNKECLKNNVKCIECMLGALTEEAESVELSPVKKTVEGEEIKDKVYSSDDLDFNMKKPTRQSAVDSVLAYKDFWHKVKEPKNCYCAPDTPLERDESSLEDKLEHIRTQFYGSVQKPIFIKKDDGRQPTITEAFNRYNK